VLWLPFAEGSGNTTKDYSGWGNDGVLYNFTDTSAGYGDTSTSGWVTHGRPNYANPLPGKAGQGYVFKGIDDYIMIEWQ